MLSLGRVAKYAELMSYNIQAMPTCDGNVLLGIVENYINSEPLIIGAGGVWFEPYAFQSDMKYYGPYKYKDEQEGGHNPGILAMLNMIILNMTGIKNVK